MPPSPEQAGAAGDERGEAPAAAPNNGLQVLFKRLAAFTPAESVAKAIAFVPRPTDVIINTPPKTGTTWMQQLVQTLRSRGDMSFDEINIPIPFMEVQHACGLPDLDAEQPWSPRAFKAHFVERDCPKGCKVIYVVRDPLEVCPSNFLYFQGWMFDEGEVSMEDFILNFMMADAADDVKGFPASIWDHIADWYPRRADPDMLWLHYEDLLQDLPAAVRLIAEFIGVGADDPELQAIAVEQGSLAFMKAHKGKYDEHQTKAARNVAMGRPAHAGADSVKVRSGQGRTKEHLTPELAAAIRAKWGEAAARKTGYDSYNEMRAGINAELGRPFK